MKRSSHNSRAHRTLRRAALSVATLGALSIATPMVAGADTVATPPSITSVSATGGDVTVSWTANDPSATSVTVGLYDTNGDVIASDTVSPTSTSDTLNNVADGGGYTAVVTDATPSGDLTSDPSTAFDLFGGSDIVDAAPVITDVTATGGDVAITWTNNAADATSIDVALYDSYGTMVQDDVVAASATTDTLTSVSDENGYSVVVTVHTPGGDLASDPSASFDVSNGDFSSDAAPTLESIDATGGAITVTWQSNAGDVTGYDVILTDSNGNQIADDSLPADATSDTLPAVADGSGYDVQIIAHTSVGDLTTDTGLVNISGGVIAQIPVDPPIVISGGPVVVDPSTVTLTPIDGGTSGWTVSWTEPSGTGTDGYYLVTTDQGDTCTVDATGNVGAATSCDLSALDGGATTLTGLTVTYYPFHIMEFGAANGGVTPVALDDAVSTDKTPSSTTVVHEERDARGVPVDHPVALGHVPAGSSTPWGAVGLVAGGVVVLGGGLAINARRRRVL